MVGAVVFAAAAGAGWQFLDAYPPQYVAPKLAAGESIVVDGVLDEAAWKAVPWTDKKFEDIAAPLFPALAPPEEYQTRVKVRWDATFFYVAAELGEPVVWGNVTGHNEGLTHGKAPWWNNDFEVFVDVSGTTHFYKEFEMNARNATYDVLWRVPDKGMNSAGVPCKADDPALWCQNSTFNSGQKWTMFPGMKTAVGAPTDVGPFSRQGWVVEIAFPIRAAGGHGGLVDADAAHDFTQHDPNAGGHFWWVDFARAEHPLKALGKKPLDIDFFTKEYQAMCADVKKRVPSLLGVGPWSCYWEFVWQNVGATQYMHNPEMWGVVQFEHEANASLCRMPDYPARHVAAMLQRAQIQHFLSDGAYATTIAALVDAKYCSTAHDCSLATLQSVVGVYSNVYTATVAVSGTTECVNYKTGSATGAPCFTITVTTTDPATRSQATARVRENRFTTSEHHSRCL